MIDFGLSKSYYDPKIKKHIPYNDNNSLVGTSLYSSLNTHLGIEQSRRDDLECLMHALIYLIKGTLPWEGIQSKNHTERITKIKHKKQTITISKLCEGLPIEFSITFYFLKRIV